MPADTREFARKARYHAKNRRYGRGHLKVRASWAPLVASGLCRCNRCGEDIEPGTAWDLGHDDLIDGRYTGPEHASCNRSAGARSTRKTSRQW